MKVNNECEELGTSCFKSGTHLHHSVSLLYFWFLFRILSPQCPLIKLLGENIAFEVAVGMNGRIWVRAKTIDNTIAVVNAISSCEFMDNTQIRTMVNRLTNALAGF